MTRIIKRYSNRKLYDPEIKSYISLTDLADLIRNSESIRVIDQSSGEDITNQIMSQIILEESRSGKNLLSTELLHDIIRWGSKTATNYVDSVRHNLLSFLPTSPKEAARNLEKEEMQELKDRISNLEKLLKNTQEYK